MHALLLPLPPALLMAAAVLAFRGSAFRPKESPKLAEWAAIGAFASAVLASATLAAWGPATSPLLGLAGLGFSFRLDLLSVIMLLLVGFVGWVVLRFSTTYLDGEQRQGPFTGWMTLTLAAVMLFVAAGNLVVLVAAWIFTGYALHQLLLFYPERPAAQRAGLKKWVVTRIGDLGIITAAGVMVWHFGTGDIATILANTSTDGWTGVTTAAFLALAALFKSAQFPTHGWLTEVMETPTPVSALLHAGVINAGGFLLIRFSDVLVAAPGVLAVLVMVGGFTALSAGLVMLTQSAVKHSLAWSTIAQMGFMILQCGLALFPLALLHIVAHSLYKAHAFLATGGAVEQVASIRRPGAVAVPDALAVGKAFLLAIGIYVLIGFLIGFEGKSPQAIALGAILILGVAYLIAQGLADAAPSALTLRTAIVSVITAVSYFALQRASEWLMTSTLAAMPAPGALEWALIILTVFSFGLVAIAQAMFPNWAYHPAAAGLRVHLNNGLYANAIFDRLIGGWKVPKST